MAETELQIHHVTKRFQALDVVADFSLDVASGRITSLVGPNGAGKTTIFNIVSGVLRADRGDVTYRSLSLSGLATWRIARLGIARTFQEPRFLRRLTVLDNVMLGRQRQPGEGALDALLLFRRGSARHRVEKEMSEAVLERVGLAERRTDVAGRLSYGQQKLLTLACCLAMEPEVLLLDEPVAGVHPSMKATFGKALVEMAREFGKTVLLIEHDLEWVLRMSDRVVVVDGGRKVVETDVASVNLRVLEGYLA